MDWTDIPAGWLPIGLHSIDKDRHIWSLSRDMGSTVHLAKVGTMDDNGDFCPTRAWGDKTEVRAVFLANYKAIHSMNGTCWMSTFLRYRNNTAKYEDGHITVFNRAHNDGTTASIDSERDLGRCVAYFLKEHGADLAAEIKAAKAA
jgi:hypothetical protein